MRTADRHALATMWSVIGAIDVMPLLLQACPSFAGQWHETEIDNADDERPGGRLFYLDAGDFIRHLVSLRLADDTSEFPAVFDVIERLVLEGDPYTSELAIIGYLEGFQMMTVTRTGLDPERDFRPWLRPESENPWLRPESEKWWQRINRFWEGDTTALSDDR